MVEAQTKNNTPSINEMIDKLQEFIERRCSATRQLMQSSGHTERAITKNFKLLCQDIIEKSSEMLSKDIAVSILLDQLRDLGWKDGQAGQNQHSMTFEEFRNSMKTHVEENKKM